MASYNLAPIGNDAPFFLSTGVAASGYKLFTYTAGSTTKQNTYQDNAGNTANANPILLNSSGYPASGGSVVEIWLTAGVNYKFVLAPSTDTDPPASPVWTRDNLVGINDVTSTISEWVAGPAPTFISATSFSLVGDQTANFTVGRRLKTTNTAGTIYSTITVSAFTSLTTVTVVNDSGTLDSGLSAVSYGILQATNVSTPQFGKVVYLSSVAGTNTITASANLAATGLKAGQFFSFTPANSITAAATLNINSLGAKNIFWNGAACSGGELVASVPAVVEYDGTQFNIIGPMIGTRKTNSLSGNVNLNNTASFFDGPTVGQGTVGTWFASGTVTVQDTAGSATYYAKLWDGTTVIASAVITVVNGSNLGAIALSGYITSPAGNIRISVRDISSTSGAIIFNATGLSVDSTVSAVRVG